MTFNTRALEALSSKIVNCGKGSKKSKLRCVEACLGLTPYTQSNISLSC